MCPNELSMHIRPLVDVREKSMDIVYEISIFIAFGMF